MLLHRKSVTQDKTDLWVDSAAISLFGLALVTQADYLFIG